MVERQGRGVDTKHKEWGDVDDGLSLIVVLLLSLSLVVCNLHRVVTYTGLDDGDMVLNMGMIINYMVICADEWKETWMGEKKTMTSMVRVLVRSGN